MTPPLVDAHCHLDAEALSDRLDDVLARARRAGVVRFVTNATEPGAWDAVEALGRAHEGVAFALGVHPWFAREDHLAGVERLRDARARGACAIGEIGLDSTIGDPPEPVQVAVFEAQLRIAADLNLPVCIHCRGAFDQLVRSFKAAGVPEAGGMVHAFSGSVDVVEQLAPYNMRFSFGRSLTYTNSRKIPEVVRHVWPERLLLETDSPDMPPVTLDVEVNEPAYIVHALARAGEVLDVPVEDVAVRTTANAAALFGWAH